MCSTITKEMKMSDMVNTVAGDLQQQYECMHVSVRVRIRAHIAHM